MAPRINLEFSLFFFLWRMKWLHYRLLCHCHSSSTVASPSSVHILHTASALACQRTAKLHWRLSSALLLIYSERLLGFWNCENSTPRPSPSSSLLLITSQYIPPSARTNETKRGPLCSGCQIHFHCGWGSQWNYVMIARNNRECRLKWCCTEHHHHNLERPSLAERWESTEGLWVVAGEIAPSIDCPGKKGKKEKKIRKQTRKKVGVWK